MTLRQYPSLSEMLAKETTNPTPKAAAHLLEAKAPQGATHAVLFKDRHGEHWLVFYSPSSEVPSLAAAEKLKVNSKTAVASCPLAGASAPAPQQLAGPAAHSSH